MKLNRGREPCCQCVCGNVQGNCGGRLLIKFGKYLFRSCNRAARQAGKKGAMDGGGGRRPRMKMREAGFVPTVGVLQAFQSGYWVCAELDIFCSFVWPV